MHPQRTWRHLSDRRLCRASFKAALVREHGAGCRVTTFAKASARQESVRARGELKRSRAQQG